MIYEIFGDTDELQSVLQDINAETIETLGKETCDWLVENYAARKYDTFDDFKVCFNWGEVSDQNYILER